MPELPEVETVRRGLEPVLVGARFATVETRRPDLRFALPGRFAEQLEGRAVVSLGRRGKYLLARLSDGIMLVMHLGMTGRFIVTPSRRVRDAGMRDGRGLARPVGWVETERERGRDPTSPADTQSRWVSQEGSTQPTAPHPESSPLPARPGRGDRLREGDGLAAFVHDTGGSSKHDHVVFALSNGATLTFNDARRFGFMLLVPESDLASHPLFRSLGPEPLGNAFNAAYLATRAAGRTADLKAFLMDQRTVAGLGNIYVSEALHRAGLSPNRAASSLAKKTGAPTERAERLVPAIRAVLKDAICAGGSTLRDYRDADGKAGAFQERFAVYGRAGEPCLGPGCGGAVRRTMQGGRSTFYCPLCQR